MPGIRLIDCSHTFKKNLWVDLSGRRTERHVVLVQLEEPAFSADRSWAPLGRTVWF
jgi:hypothetical protein